ncbi:zinc finger protein 410 isoform X1 [Diachasma alloeum]|uniref:zinc finger protein 410 isoform X1 n=1 Tax=Diachasma alloeum TaxID=454923 RepID=UPI0007381146|nr:zinc finger protein 410 isoform X1 [Diachasma alloeum]XP_015126048.1 zinc finger protein 410 isoform X1 [Diachasma alloeum]XP_015126049.1 zinc finger protein 410 isoform X1 [Diachasma alloeum]XP_015126050.1 zinc finger protein 410 isoform X1 [Diachasma alloeum]XP_015126052.1 zinc finger protein 410 isoform X1 [Diachasma alloeum]
MGQGTECPDRPTEVSVIRFVSRNRTIEEIAPKKEIFTCKQQGCGKIFTNQDEFKTHEALEELKIRFICREPGCGKELSDPGTMWRHYQEFHSNETSVFVCPYTSCGSLHSTSENLEEHIENSHRQPPTLPTEPEIICFEGPVNNQVNGEDEPTKTTADDEEEELEEEDTPQNEDDDFFDRDKKNARLIKTTATHKSNNYIIAPKGAQNNERYSSKDERLTRNDTDGKITVDTSEIDEYSNDYQNNSRITEASEEEYFINIYEDTPKVDAEEIVFEATEEKIQDHRIDLGNLESVFRSGFEGETKKIDSSNAEGNGNCSEDEEYTPKKQRMSRYKQEQPYKCEINGCGKTYKYISHYRHHQDSHKVQENNSVNKLSKPTSRQSKGKATTVSFFLCKIPGCGAQASNVTTLWKHYQDNHANSKANVSQSTKNNQSFRCKITNCEMEFRSSAMLYKHFNQIHTNVTQIGGSTNGKTGNGNIRFRNDGVAQVNFKTEFKAKYVNTTDDYDDDERDMSNGLRIKEESRD